MSKYPNPVRGYVPCPVCTSISTVHQTGEGRLMALGEPPKNARNIGIKYFRCPECGNSAISKSIDEYIEKHYSTEKPSVTPLEGEVLEPLALTDDNALAPVTSVEPDIIDEASDDKVSNTEVTEPLTEEKPPVEKPFFTLKRVITALGVLIVLLWAFRKLMPQPQEEEVSNAATE
jgi:hypothetical protein